jgi:hypothetical protein
MGNLLRAPNGNALFMAPRSGSHSIAYAAVQSFWPEVSLDGVGHASCLFPVQESYTDQTQVGIVVRNPVERFKSMVARSDRTIEQQLERPQYRPLPHGPFARYFLFETQLQECADWLGITVPLPDIDSTEESDKPTLTVEQEARVREIYATDIALWESLQT